MRPDWDDYFLLIANAVAARGECLRSQVGAVLVRDKRIVATGYNGVTAGMPSCLNGVCPRQVNNTPKGAPYSGRGECIAIHAEMNAVRDATARGLEVYGGTMYLNKQPCEVCAGMLAHYQLRVVWRQNPSSDSTATAEIEDFPG